MQLSRQTLIPLAFASVYICWGSTYAAIHVAGEHLAVPVVSGTRSILSATIILSIALLLGKGLRVPEGEPWKLVLIGLLFMSGNNMLLTWGEKLVPSGFASLIIATIPIMVALLEALRRGGDPLNKRGWLGTLLGTVGIGILVLPSLRGAHLHGTPSATLLGVLVLLGAAFSFAAGSVLSRHFQFKADPFVATGWQIAAAGIFNVTLAGVTGGFRSAQWTWQGLSAIAYLSIFGSLFGLVAFTYLLQNVAVTKVATYAFVNPVIAVLLGIFVLHERLSHTEVTGMAVIVCAVAMVIYSRVRGAPARPLVPAAEVPE